MGLYVGLAAVMLVPLLWARVPPLVDYPNHLARMWILVHRATIPELARNYVINWRILPDLGMDLVVPALARMMPVVEAGRVFVALTMLGLVTGTITLYRLLHGRFSVWPAWSVLFVYNAVLFWGFVDCLFAIGVYLFAFSGWIASHRWRLGPRLLLFSVVGAGLFLLHLFAFGLYGLSVSSYEFARRIEGRRLPIKNLVSYSLICLQFIPGLVLWYLSLGNLRSTYTDFGSWTYKAYALFAPFDFGVAGAPFDIALGFAAALFLLFSLGHRSFKLVPEMRFPIAAMVVAAIFMPNWVNGSWLAGIRLPASLPFVLIASSELHVTRKWLVGGLSAAALVFFGLRIWTVAQSWHDYERWFDEYRSASTTIAPGARLLIVEPLLLSGRQQLPDIPPELATLQPHVFDHMGALTVIDRSAFYPYLFTQATPLAVSARNADIAESTGDPVRPEALVKSADPEQAKSLYATPDVRGQLPYWRDWPRTFDYLLWIDFGKVPKPSLKQLKPLVAGSFFEIYKIVRR